MKRMGEDRPSKTLLQGASEVEGALIGPGLAPGHHVFERDPTDGSSQLCMVEGLVGWKGAAMKNILASSAFGLLVTAYGLLSELDASSD